MSKSILPSKRHYPEICEGPIHDDDDDLVMPDIQHQQVGDVVVEETNSMDQDEHEEEEKTYSNFVYLSVRTSDDWRKNYSTVWYVLDTDACTLVRDDNMSSFMLPRYCACAVMGSKVYAIGGETLQGTLTNQVTVYDTLSSNRCWEYVPYMYGWRTSPTAVTLGKRIYVFGGRVNPPFCEFYDSTTNDWTSIPDPPSKFSPYRYRGAAVYAQSTIIIWNMGDFFLLDVSGSIPKWYFMKSTEFVELSNDDFVSNNTAVVNGIVYWSARDLFAFDLAHNKGFDKPAFKFDDDSNSTVAPSIDFLFDVFASPPILAVTEKDQLSVIWFLKEFTADQCLKLYCKKFRIQISDDSEKQLLLHNDHDPTENLEFDIPGINLYQYGAVKWHHDDKEKHNLYRDDTKHAVLNHVDLLQNLSCSMFKENFNSFSRIKQKDVVVEFKDGSLELVDLELKARLAQQEELFVKDRMSIEDFLNGLGLQKYAKIFVENNIDMNDLKSMNREMLKNLKIPMGPSRVILSAINVTS
ncbi:hypothetical protein FRX31_013988 [Thalictrum thalictroides]|uniref:SAM domain-containing protein n=1 Tax=Thalictrum thalictroides TaxID=46969 RepID=A0A7J6WHP7_THATH|nr:hypothetical protein FRX31_013988 [Thalictrum thalictroides]